MCLIFCKTILQSFDMVYTGLLSECEEYLIHYHIGSFCSKKWSTKIYDALQISN